MFSGLIRCASCKNTLTRKTVGKYKYYSCSFAKTVKGSCIGCQISIKKFDTYAQRMIQEHIDEIVSLRQRIAAGNLEDKLQQQITRLQEHIQTIELEIDKKQFFIRKLEPTMREGLITAEEVNELRNKFESEQRALEQDRNELLKQIRQIEDGTVLELPWTEQFMPYVGQTTFSRKDIAMLVETIFLYKDKHIEIHFVHDKEFQYIQQMLA